MAFAFDFGRHNEVSVEGDKVTVAPLVRNCALSSYAMSGTELACGYRPMRGTDLACGYRSMTLVSGTDLACGYWSMTL
eukprot:1589239-Rhodomonas_salina.1